MDVCFSNAVLFHLGLDLASYFNEDGAGATLRLFKNDVMPSPFATVADFEECDFFGYAPFTGMTNWFVNRDPFDGDVLIFPDYVVNYQFDASDPINTIFGWYLTDSGGGTLHAWGRFEDPPSTVVNEGSLQFIARTRLALKDCLAVF